MAGRILAFFIKRCNIFYMKKIQEMIEGVEKSTWIIGGTVVLILIILSVTVWPFSLFKKEKNTMEINSETKEFVAQATEKVFTKENILRGEYQNDVRGATTYVNSTQEVRVAVVVDEQAKKVIGETQEVSCGHIAFVTTRVVGPAILTNTLKAIFADKVATDFTPGNSIPSYHPELTFESVSIQDGVAKIYLGGNFSGAHSGVCDASLAIAQLVETAKTFPNIVTVEVYLSGQKIY